jgi:hypothetical protein
MIQSWQEQGTVKLSLCELFCVLIAPDQAESLLDSMDGIPEESVVSLPGHSPGVKPTEEPSIISPAFSPQGERFEPGG